MKLKIFESLKRKSPAETAIYCIVSALFMALALSYVYIIVWMVIAACKTHPEIVLSPFTLPEKWHWEHFLEVPGKLEVNGSGFWKMLFNSCWFSIVGVLYGQFLCLVFAYTVTKYKFPLSKYTYTFMLILMTLPLYGASGGMYKLLHSLGMIDSYAQIFCSGNVFGSSATLYYMAYFKNLSNTYMEAAKVDGANHFQTCYRIMLPQAKPLFTAFFVMSWMADWNNYSSALIYLPNTPTLPVGIFQFNTEMIYRARLDILFAACIVTLIPALVMFIVFNKTITTSVSLGGIKG